MLVDTFHPNNSRRGYSGNLGKMRVKLAILGMGFLDYARQSYELPPEYCAIRDGLFDD
jgi:hypothetical protein